MQHDPSHPQPPEQHNEQHQLQQQHLSTTPDFELESAECLEEVESSVRDFGRVNQVRIIHGNGNKKYRRTFLSVLSQHNSYIVGGVMEIDTSDEKTRVSIIYYIFFKSTVIYFCDGLKDCYFLLPLILLPLTVGIMHNKLFAGKFSDVSQSLSDFFDSKNNYNFVEIYSELEMINKEKKTAEEVKRCTLLDAVKSINQKLSECEEIKTNYAYVKAQVNYTYVKAQVDEETMFSNVQSRDHTVVNINCKVLNKPSGEISRLPETVQLHSNQTTMGLYIGEGVKKEIDNALKKKEDNLEEAKPNLHKNLDRSKIL